MTSSPSRSCGGCWRRWTWSTWWIAAVIITPLRTSGGDDVIPEAELRRLLAAVDLEYLVERQGGLGAVVDWGGQLSLGEQQRLGMARLFYHRPKFAILDECTSGVTVRFPLSRVTLLHCLVVLPWTGFTYL